MDDWKKMCVAVEKMWPEVADQTTVRGIEEVMRKLAKETELLDLISKYPDLVNNLPTNINLLLLPSDQKAALQSFLTAGGQVATDALIKLAVEPITDVEKLVEILNSYRLSTANSLVTHITGRLSFIDTFENIIHNDSSYERRGDDSVHNLLKQNIWIVDRNYSILHDDITLKRIVEEQWSSSETSDQDNNRPDFLCMSDENNSTTKSKLILIEIKRPSVTLTFKFVEQILGYLTILKNHSSDNIIEFKAYLIGREINPMLKATDLSKSGIYIKTYTDLIGDARKFYKEYREIWEKQIYSF